MMDYWSFGVLDEYRAEEHGVCFSADRDMIICSVKVIGEKQTQGGAGNSF